MSLIILVSVWWYDNDEEFHCYCLVFTHGVDCTKFTYAGLLRLHPCRLLSRISETEHVKYWAEHGRIFSWFHLFPHLFELLLWKYQKNWRCDVVYDTPIVTREGQHDGADLTMLQSNEGKHDSVSLRLASIAFLKSAQLRVGLEWLFPLFVLIRSIVFHLCHLRVFRFWFNEECNSYRNCVTYVGLLHGFNIGIKAS